VTPAIAQAMRTLERLWDAHRDALIVHRDLEAAVANMASEPAVLHLPAATGAEGQDAIRRFYAEAVLPLLPVDLTVTRVSRTVGQFRLADEVTVSFTHDRPLPWLLPGVEPTNRRVGVSAVALVGFERGLLRSLRIHWDQATLLAQLGVGTLAGSR
jgi:carboxymethylenebutenolidase